MMNADGPAWPTVPLRDEPLQFPSEEVDPNDLPEGDSTCWPFVVAPQPGVPVVPTLQDLVCTLVCLIWLEPDRFPGQDTQDSCGPRDPKSVCRAIVDMRDNLGSVHRTLYDMQNVMDDCQVEQVHGEDFMSAMSVCLDLMEEKFERFIVDDWAPFQFIILQALSTVTFAGQACLRSHASYQPPPSSLTTSIDIACAQLTGLRVSLDSPVSLGGPPSSVPSLISLSSSSSNSSALPIFTWCWHRLSPLRSDGGEASEGPAQQENSGHQAEMYTSGSEEGVMVPYI